MLVDDLQQIGFTKNDAEVFVALVKLSPCHVAPIVSETKKHRQVVYNALESLEDSNIVSVSKKRGKNLYSVSDVSHILTNIKQLEILAKDVVNKVEKKLAKQDDQAQIYSVPDAYSKSLAQFRKNAEASGEFIVYGGQGRDWFRFNQDIFDHHISELRRISKNGVDVFILFFPEEWKSIGETFHQYIDDPYLVKIAKDQVLPETAWIAGDNVYIMTPVSEPIVLHIKSPALAKKYRDHFWKEWLASKRVSK